MTVQPAEETARKGLPSSELSAGPGVSPVTIKRHYVRLKSHGLVMVARKRGIVLTEKGAQLLKMMSSEREKVSIVSDMVSNGGG